MMASDMASNNFPWLTLAIFVPIVFGLLVLALGRDDRPGLTRGLSLIGALAGFLVTIPLYGFRSRYGADAVRREGVLDRGLQRQLPSRHRRHLAVVRAADGLHHYHRGGRRLAGDHQPRGAVHGRLPDPVGPDGGRVRRARRHAVLRVLRSDPDPDVHHHRRVGRTQPRVRGVQVLPVHAAGLAADAGGLRLPVERVGRFVRHPDLAPKRPSWATRRRC